MVVAEAQALEPTIQEHRTRSTVLREQARTHLDQLHPSAPEEDKLKAWMLEDVRQSQIDESGVVASRAPRARWESVFRPDLVSVVAVRPESPSARLLQS